MSASPQVAPHGSWRSPLSAAEVARGGIGLSGVALTEEAAYWIESRPSEGGRNVVVRRGVDGVTRDVTPLGFNARSRVHEYGGGHFLVDGEAVYFANFADQRLYRQDGPGSEPRPITPEPESEAARRYADCRLLADGATLVCVRESHAGEVTNELVVLPTNGGSAPRVIVAGNDFYASPRPSPDAKHLAWLTWNHPNMPWDGGELWVAELGPHGDPVDARMIAGGEEISVFGPVWGQGPSGGTLFFAADPSGWWNLHAWRAESGEVTRLVPREAEFGGPQWVFDDPTLAPLADGRLACAVTTNARTSLEIFDPASGEINDLGLPFTSISGLRAHGSRLAFVAGGATEPSAVVELDLGGEEPSSAVLRRGRESALPAAFVATARAIEFETDGDRRAHALYYPPANPDHAAPDGELPPLIVLSHGGPTGHSEAVYDSRIQFWTTRGLAVVDVNYGGSTGYGRDYRERLNGQWGIVDLADCVNAALHLARAGEVDPARMAISGGSAGGYTTLCALTFSDAFAAGASYFGIGDLETMARDTHKFESRYLDRLVGPYPAAADVYRARSPIHFAERLSCPVILFQGLDDEVVPPAQAEAMVAALRANAIPHAYLPFEGEQHGFRRAETVIAALEAELSFYAQVFGFAPADPIAPVSLTGPTQTVLR